MCILSEGSKVNQRKGKQYQNVDFRCCVKCLPHANYVRRKSVLVPPPMYNFAPIYSASEWTSSVHQFRSHMINVPIYQYISTYILIWAPSCHGLSGSPKMFWFGLFALLCYSVHVSWPVIPFAYDEAALDFRWVARRSSGQSIGFHILVTKLEEKCQILKKIIFGLKNIFALHHKNGVFSKLKSVQNSYLGCQIVQIM